MNDYSLGELMFFALQEVEENKEAQMDNKHPLWIKYDLSFLVDIALDNRDESLFDWCMEVNK